jgi:hypothetical protein
MPNTLYMVVEHFKDAVAVYRRFRDNGRMAPEGLTYVSSRVDDEFERCYQLMETQDRRLLEAWMANWSDLVDFDEEIRRCLTSGQIGSGDNFHVADHPPVICRQKSSILKQRQNPNCSDPKPWLSCTMPI